MQWPNEKRPKGTSNGQKYATRKLMIEQHDRNYNPGLKKGAHER